MNKLRIVLMSSGGVSLAPYFFSKDKNCGKNYNIACEISTDHLNTEGKLFLKQKNIPFIEVNPRKFCLAQEPPFTDSLANMPHSTREDYFYFVLKKISQFKPDLILLYNFELVIIKPLLGRIPIINVYPADLSIKDSITGKPKYIGNNPVAIALEDGQKWTASTVHVVERGKGVNYGRIISISNGLLVPQGVTSKKHRDSMGYMCDGPVCIKALALICSGEFEF